MSEDSARERANRAIAIWAERLLHEDAKAQWPLAQARLDKLRFHPALRRRWAEARAEVAVRAAAGAATLVGARVGADRLRNLVMQPQSQLQADEAVAVAHWRAWTFAIHQWPDLGAQGASLAMPLSRLLFSCGYMIATEHVPGTSVQEFDLNESALDSTESVLRGAANSGEFVLPKTNDPALQVALTCMEDTQNGVIRAGIVQAQLAQLHSPRLAAHTKESTSPKEPEVWGGVAHIAAGTTLVNSFVDPTGLAQPVVIAAKDPLRYRGALRAYQRGDVQRWLEYWLDCVARAVTEAEKLADAVVAGTLQS